MKNCIYLEAPNQLEAYSQFDWKHSIFLAGTITGACDWQSDVKNLLSPYFNVFNPRRKSFNVTNKNMEREQIAWEYKYLELAGITLFYFSNETLAPITLLEYGKQLAKCQYQKYRKTYVCIHPDYKRKNDVIIQTELCNPEWVKNIYDDLGDMCGKIIEECY